MSQVREEYPRPQFFRDSWLNLNGEWQFQFDDNRDGMKEQWFKGTKEFTEKIVVPFTFQSKLSEIHNNTFHDVVWYKRSVSIPSHFKENRIILHFGAVDYDAAVWVNGMLVAQHEGGHTPFHTDITDVLHEGHNEIVLRAEDYSTNVRLPRGKQYWKEKSASIWYTGTTGIWQTVWMEAVSPTHIKKVKYTPDIDQNEIEIAAYIDGVKLSSDIRLHVTISFKGNLVSEDSFKVTAETETRKIKLHDFNDHGLHRWWSPENPNLFDVEYKLEVAGEVVDNVASYFGMRKISVGNGKLCLNNRPYFMKMVLDQGYFPDGNLTPPSDEAIRKDVELTKEMGFNGARKHQKVEDPRYLYWCDKLGLLVWGEMANAYDYSADYVRRITKEWQEVIERDYNHPSIVAWVPINESWGVPNIQIDKEQQLHALSLFYLTKSLDSTRLVVSNDGWELVETDLFTIHDYEWRQEVLEERYRTIDSTVNAMPANRKLAVSGYDYKHQPILITEFGGISYQKSDWEGWGYSGAENDQDYIDRVNAVTKPLCNNPIIQGYCYTQLTDVEQEINGLLTYDRKPKVPLEVIKKINLGEYKS